MTFPPLLFAIIAWFVGTAAVVWLDSRPRRTFGLSFALAGVAALAATVAVRWLAAGSDWTSAYAGFAAAIVIWGWHEMGFLMGFVAGPSKAPCPAGLTGWARFKAATATVIHHEIALALHLALLVALSWELPNQAAPLTFGLLFVLRLSAKFNLYLGMPNLSDEVFPEHLAYLKSYFRKAAMNPLFPWSIALGVTVTLIAWRLAEAAPANSAAAATGALIAGLAALGVVEHLFLVLPMKDAKLFRWASAKPTDKITVGS